MVEIIKKTLWRQRGGKDDLVERPRGRIDVGKPVTR